VQGRKSCWGRTQKGRAAQATHCRLQQRRSHQVGRRQTGLVFVAAARGNEGLAWECAVPSRKNSARGSHENRSVRGRSAGTRATTLCVRNMLLSGNEPWVSQERHFGLIVRDDFFPEADYQSVCRIRRITIGIGPSTSDNCAYCRLIGQIIARSGRLTLIGGPLRRSGPCIVVA
jgi:hypothetical protein